jgi:SPP1 family phage portal protein
MASTNENKDSTAYGTAMSPLYTGRKTIYANPVDLSVDSNVLAVLEQSMIDHEVNRTEMKYLKEYEKGDQPIFYRVKNVRSEINIKACANYAKLITDFKVGYEFGSPVMYVQRAADDYRKADVKQDDKRIARLNEMMWEQNKFGKDIELADDFKTTGLGYMLAYPKLEESDDIAPFDLIVLNPLNTFCVYSNDAYRRKMMAVTYSWIRELSIARCTVYTRDWIYTILGDKIEDKRPNILGVIPIIEYKNDVNKIACFEAVIPLADALNISNSDRCNDLAQYVQAILWFHNCRIDEDQKADLRDAGFVQTATTADGKEAKIEYITTSLNQSETQSLIDYMYSQMLEIAGVPGRESSTGGNTGAAILLSNGWQLAETMAKTMEPVFAASEMELLDVIIAILQNTPDVPEELKELKKSDILVKFSRNKTYDLVSRTSALSNMINMGIDPGKAIAVVDIFDDAQQVTLDSLERINELLFSSKEKKTEVQNGDGITVDGVKGADDYNAEQNRENETAV